MAEEKDSEQEMQARLARMEDRWKRHYDQWAPIYEDGRNYIFANQLESQEIKEGWEHIQVNIIYPAITQEQSLLAQRRATIVTLPFESGDEDGAEFWGTQLQWQYETGLNVPMLLMNCVLDGKMYGHWVAEVKWNAEHEWNVETDEWEGAVTAKLRRPEFVCLDPDSELADDPEWVYVAEMVAVSEMVEKYPDFEKEIRAAIGGEHGPDTGQDAISRLTTHIKKGSYRDDKGEAATGDSEGRLADLLSANPADARGMTKEQAVTEKVPVLWALMKDPERVDDEEVYDYSPDEMLEQGLGVLRPDPENEGKLGWFDPSTGESISIDNWPNETRKFRRPLYPRGRYVVRIGDTIVEDRPWDLRYWPWAIGHNQLLPHTWHGLNGVEMPKGLQDFLNSFARHMVNYVKFFGDPITAVEEGAVANKPGNRKVAEVLKSSAGAIWKLATNAIRGQKIKRFDPPAMSQGVLTIYEMMAKEARDQTGVQEIALGRQAKGNMTATESIALASNSKMRTAFQSLLLEHFILRLMRRVQELCQTHMTPGQMVRIAGEQAEHLMAAVPEGAVDARFDLRLKVTSEVPFDKDARKQDAIELYKLLGLPFLERLLDEYLEVVGDKGEILENVQAYQAILAVVEQKRQQQAAAEAGMGSAGGRGQGESRNGTQETGPQAQSPTRRPAA